MYEISNATNPADLLISISSQVPILFPMILFFEFCVIAIGGAFTNQRRVGYTNISMWFAIAGLITTTSAFILFMVDGLINLATLGVVCAVTFASVLWFFFSGDEQ